MPSPAPSRKPDDKVDRVLWMIRCLQDEKKFMTPWEVNFTDSIESWYEDHGVLSPKQQEVLERIYKEILNRPAFNVRRGWRPREE